MYDLIDNMQKGKEWKKNKENKKTKEHNLKIFYCKEKDFRHKSCLIDVIIKAPLPYCFGSYIYPETMTEF